MPSPRNFMARHGLGRSPAPKRAVIRTYRFRPSHDQVMYTDQLKNGMWIIPDMQVRAHRQLPVYDRRRAEMRSMVTHIRDDPRARTRRWIAEFADDVQQGFTASYDDTFIVSAPSCKLPPVEGRK